MQTHMDVINEIMNDSTDFDVLDVQHRTGLTGYIDFIDLSEITAPVMKGIDIFSRPFFTVCAEIQYHGDENIIPTFTTFFQRYTDNPRLWMACGKYHELIATQGGMTVSQLVFLRDLLKHGNVIFDDGTDDNTVMNIRIPNYNIDENKNISVTNVYKRPMSVKLSLCTATQQ